MITGSSSVCCLCDWTMKVFAGRLYSTSLECIMRTDSVCYDHPYGDPPASSFVTSDHDRCEFGSRTLSELRPTNEQKSSMVLCRCDNRR
jgi:hypothetical protein